MVIIVYKEKVLLDKEVPNIIDPLTQNNGVAFVVTRTYAELFLLPFLVTSKKKVTAYSISSNDPIPLQLWTAEMKNEAEVAKSEAKGTWKLFMFWYVFIILIGGAFIYTRLQMHSKNKDEKQQAEYLANPQVGDILYVSTFTNDGVYVSPFKIADIKGDSLLVIYSNEKKESTTKYLDQSKMVGDFDISESKFSSETLVFDKKFYEGRHLTKFQKKKSSSELSEPSDNLLEIKYIQRL